MTAPQVSLGSVNLEAEDPRALSGFWAQVLGATPAPAGDYVFLPPANASGFAMFFQPLTGPRPERSTIHLDLTVPWGARTSEVSRLVALGATKQWDMVVEGAHVHWTTMTDPEGNLFCVAEHPPAEVAEQSPT
jgi:hypothetical protein